MLSTFLIVLNFQNSLEILLSLLTDEKNLNNLPTILQPVHGRLRFKARSDFKACALPGMPFALRYFS